MDALLYDCGNFIIPESPSDVTLKPCPICGRTFIPSTLEKHVYICERMQMKKRKIFDSSRQRREGTDLADYLPKNFGLPSQKQDIRVSPPKTTMIAKKPEITKTPIVEKKIRSNSLTSYPSPSLSMSVSASQHVKDTPKISKRSLGPVSEQCPYCERSFGIKAYDRHVEWCKEKSRFTFHNTTASVNAAKERLQARINYRAPNVKSKRAFTREKYSGSFDDGFSDHGSMTPMSLSSYKLRTPTDGEFSFNKRSTSNSMTSSITSEGGLSDKYDPFLSAKRQLEELFSPTTSTPLKTEVKSKTNPTPSSVAMTKSSVTSPTTKLNSLKSNFRRTSSLRIPKKTTPIPAKSIFAPKPPSNIQRGISDEGPISSHFVKPEVFDEIPVKSIYACDYSVLNTTPNKEVKRKSPSPVAPLRDPRASLNRRNLKLDIHHPSAEYPISKTDSLAVFLRYEHDLSNDPSLTEKEMKDKSNSLSKRSLQMSPIVTNNNNNNNIYNFEREKSAERIVPSFSSQPQKYVPIKLSPLERPKFTPLTLDQILKPHEKIDNNFIDPKLINLRDNLSVSISRLSDTDTTTSSSTESNETAKQLPRRSNDNLVTDNKIVNLKNSGEKRSQLKRQIKLEKDNFLYDKSPTTNTNGHANNLNNNNNNNNKNINNHDPYSEQCDKTISLIDTNSNRQTTNIESMFDDFDLDEFISSFEDDEQYPIFKEYKELMLNNQSNKCDRNQSNESINSDRRSPSKSPTKSFDEIPKNLSSSEFLKENSVEPNSLESIINSNGNVDESDEFIEEQIVDSPSPPLPLPPPPTAFTNANKYRIQRDFSTTPSPPLLPPPPPPPSRQPKNDDDYDETERELLRSVRELDRMCESSTTYPLDSDEISSVESYPLHRNVGSKFNADSAYGSLSRQSPPDKPIRRTTNSRPRQQQTMPEIITITKSKSQQPQQYLKRRDDISSSGSESSLPPINAQKMELHHKEKQQQQQSQDYQQGTGDVKLSKFCHECGSKFLVNQAKFCMDCGVRRVVI